MASINKMILVGNVGKQPEIKTTQHGKKIASFSIATSEKWKDKATGEQREKTEWHNIVIFNEALAGVVECYVNKGSKLYIEGQHQTRKWSDKEGVERYSSECVLQGFNGTLVLLDKIDNSQRQNPTQEQPAQEQQQPSSKEFDDVVPF